MHTDFRNASGFTIVELLVTAVIVSILALGVFPSAELALRRTKEQELRRNLITLRNALDAYKRASDEGRISAAPGASGYPPGLEALMEGVSDASSPNGTRLFFLRRIPRDPFAAESNIPAAQTWGKRSYASTAKNPKEGSDVFDVFSRSDSVGINGLPYREW